MGGRHMHASKYACQGWVDLRIRAHMNAGVRVRMHARTSISMSASTPTRTCVSGTGVHRCVRDKVYAHTHVVLVRGCSLVRLKLGIRS